MNRLHYLVVLAVLIYRAWVWTYERMDSIAEEIVVKVKAMPDDQFTLFTRTFCSYCDAVTVTRA